MGTSNRCHEGPGILGTPTRSCPQVPNRWTENSIPANPHAPTGTSSATRFQVALTPPAHASPPGRTAAPSCRATAPGQS